MNQMEIFQNPEFGSVRIAVDGEKYFFCGMDVARALGYKDTVNALKAHCKEDGVAFYLKARLKLKPNQVCDVYEIDAAAGE